MTWSRQNCVVGIKRSFLRGNDRRIRFAEFERIGRDLFDGCWHDRPDLGCFVTAFYPFQCRHCTVCHGYADHTVITYYNSFTCLMCVKNVIWQQLNMCNRTVPGAKDS